MLLTLWVLFHWEDWESFIIASIPFRLLFLVAMTIIMLIVRFRGRIPIFWANVLAGGIAGWATMQVFNMTVPYVLDFKDYRESVRQLDAQERLRQQREAPVVEALPVEYAGGMAGLEAIKVLVAILPYWHDERAQRRNASQLDDQARLQPQKQPEAVGVNPVTVPVIVPEKVLDELSAPSEQR